MRLTLIIVALIAAGCGSGDDNQIKETRALPEILGGTDSFMVKTLKREKIMLVGQKLRTTYENFNTNREGTLGFIGAIMSRMAHNNCKLLGPVHIVMLAVPTKDSMDYFIGIPSSSSSGFITNEIYEIPGGQYYVAQVGKASGQALPKHAELQNFLKSQKYNYQMPIIEVWKEQMERDMTKHENLQLQYRVK